MYCTMYNSTAINDIVNSVEIHSCNSQPIFIECYCIYFAFYCFVCRGKLGLTLLDKCWEDLVRIINRGSIDKMLLSPKNMANLTQH